MTNLKKATGSMTMAAPNRQALIIVNDKIFKAFFAKSDSDI